MYTVYVYQFQGLFFPAFMIHTQILIIETKININAPISFRSRCTSIEDLYFSDN